MTSLMQCVTNANNQWNCLCEKCRTDITRYGFIHKVVSDLPKIKINKTSWVGAMFHLLDQVTDATGKYNKFIAVRHVYLYVFVHIDYVLENPRLTHTIDSKLNELICECESDFVVSIGLHTLRNHWKILPCGTQGHQTPEVSVTPCHAMTTRSKKRKTCA